MRQCSDDGAHRDGGDDATDTGTCCSETHETPPEGIRRKPGQQRSIHREGESESDDASEQIRPNVVTDAGVPFNVEAVAQSVSFHDGIYPPEATAIVNSYEVCPECGDA
jgi:hypothetical protein